MVEPSNTSASSLPFSLSRKIFGIGHRGVWLSSRASARGESASIPCAASPPSTFCHDQVTTSSFSQGSSIANTAEVASQSVSPSRSRGIQSPFGTRTPEVVPFQVKTTSRSNSTVARSGSSPYGASSTRAFRPSCSVTSVTQPWPKLSHASTSTARGPSSDHIAISIAPVSEAGHDPELEIRGQAEQRAAAVDHRLQAILADLRAVRAAERGALQRLEAPARPLGAGAGGELGAIAVGGWASSAIPRARGRAVYRPRAARASPRCGGRRRAARRRPGSAGGRAAPRDSPARASPPRRARRAP